LISNSPRRPGKGIGAGVVAWKYTLTVSGASTTGGVPVALGVGILTRSDLLAAHGRRLEETSRAEQSLDLRRIWAD